MFTSTHDEFSEHWIVRLLPTRTISEAQNLWYRFQEGKSFRLYLSKRLRLVLPAALLILFIGVASAASFVVVATGMSGWLALPAIIMMPVMLVGSLFVQSYMFFSWLENRAMSRMLGRRAKQLMPAANASKKFKLDMGPAPRIPWVLVALFFVAPLVLLSTFVLEVALALFAAAVVVPVAYARLDR